MLKPLVSIIVPSYNSAYFLPETIESVLKQSYQNWEMLIVDDGSSDNTLSIAGQYAAKDNRIRVFSLGYNSARPAVPRNYGMRQAKGDYIAFLDSDDLWLTEKLQKQVAFLENNRDIFLLYSQCIIEKDGKQLSVSPRKPMSGRIFKDLFLYFNFIDCLTVIMRNNKEKNIYFFDEDIRLAAAEDYAMWLLIARNEQIAFLNEPLAIYKIHSKGISTGAFLNFKKCGLVLRKFSPHVSKPILLRGYLNFYSNLIFVRIMVALIALKKSLFNPFAKRPREIPKKTKLLFIYSLYNIASAEKPLRSPELIQFGISYISSYLKRHGYNTELIVLSRLSGKKNLKMIDEYMEKFKPEIVAFSPITTEFDFIKSIARYIRKKFPAVYLIIGGFHVSINPQGVLDDFDALCIGEGERPVLELIEQLKENKVPSGIPNLWIKNKAGIEKNPTRPFLQDLDLLPFPDRQMWRKWIKLGRGARHSVLLGRGCPFNCTYCCNHAFKKISAGQYARYRSPENVVREIKEITQKYPINKEIYLEIESIGIDKEWAVKLCQGLSEFNRSLQEPLSFGVNLRITPNLDLNYLFPAFKKANFRFINIGLESGSERIRREVLNRNYANEDIVNAVKLAKAHGLQVAFLNMLGLPGETEQDFRETIEMNRRCLPDWTGSSIFYPSPGTDLYASCKRQGLLQGPLTTEMERSRAVIDLPGFSRKRIEKNYVWFEYNVYKGHKPLARLLLRTLRLKIETRPFLFSLSRAIKFLFGLGG